MADAAETERRRSERMLVEHRVALVTTPGAMPKNHEAIMIDVSDHGTRIQTRVGLKPGQPVELVTDQTGPTPAHIMRSEVVWMSKPRGEAGLQLGESVQLRACRRPCGP